MAGRIRDGDIAEIRDRNRVDEVIGEYVALRRAGAGSLKGLCPFHDEKTASFNVRPAHGTFHCFGCGEGGSVIDFVMKIEHIGFVEAVERLADRAGYRLTYTGGGSSVQRDRGTRSRLLEANRRAAEFYAEQLRTPQASPAMRFLTSRGFDAASAERFGCGFAPADWDALTKRLLAAGFTLDELAKAGLSKDGRKGPIDRFRRRLLWPIRDLGGDVVGFGARRLFDDDPIEAKYLNTAETSVYRKTHVLFGLDLAKREIVRRRQAVIVEGYTDVMAMHLAGVPTAVATSGTSFGTEHVAVLRRLMGDDSFDLGEVIFTFDGDDAGRAAALKAFEGDQQFVGQTFVAIAPDGLDPCELRQARGDAAVRDLVACREPLFEFAIRTLLAEHDLDTTEGQVAALRRTVPLVAQIKDVALRDGYAKRLAGWVGWADEAMVVNRVRDSAGAPPARDRSARRVSARRAEPDVADWPAADDPRLALQRESLKAALQLPAVAGPAYDELPPDAFTHPAYVAVHTAVLAAGGAGAGLAGSAWLDAVSSNCPAPVRGLLTELAVEQLRLPRKHTDEARYVASVLAGVRLAPVEAQIKELKSKLQRMTPDADVDAYFALAGDLMPLEQYAIGLRLKAAGAVAE